jgi:hypothetical protein
MAVSVVALARNVTAWVTVQAAGMPQHLGHALEGLERRLALRRRLGAGGRGGPYAHTAGEQRPG